MKRLTVSDIILHVGAMLPINDYEKELLSALDKDDYLQCLHTGQLLLEHINRGNSSLAALHIYMIIIMRLGFPFARLVSAGVWCNTQNNDLVGPLAIDIFLDSYRTYNGSFDKDSLNLITTGIGAPLNIPLLLDNTRPNLSGLTNEEIMLLLDTDDIITRTRTAAVLSNFDWLTYRYNPRLEVSKLPLDSGGGDGIE